jgi:hypothetical protein
MVCCTMTGAAVNCYRCCYFETFDVFIMVCCTMTGAAACTLLLSVLLTAVESGWLVTCVLCSPQNLLEQRYHGV